MSAREEVVYSENGTVAFINGYGTRNVLRLTLPTSDAVADYYPPNLKETLKAVSRAPGETFDWFVPLSDGERQDLLYRTKVADAIVESLDLPVEDDTHSGYILDRLPAGYKLFAYQRMVIDAKGTPTTMAAESSRAQITKAIATQANLIQAASEKEKDIQDGGWKFRKGEVVWAHLRSETGELGGTWFAALVIKGPETVSFADYANIYTSVDQNRGFYRVQKCGSDTDVHMIHLSDLLPWTKVPQPDEPRNITVDEVSKAAAEEACSSYFIVARDAVDYKIYESGKIIYDLKGLFLGPEKLWIGDAVRIARPSGVLPEISIWDPQQYDVVLVRRIILATTTEPITTEDGTVERIFIFYVIGDVITMYPLEDDNTTEMMDRNVPNYIKNIGTDRPKWVARCKSNGMQKMASLSSAYILSRFYDPRIMALMDRRWSTSDDVLHIERLLDHRAESLGFKIINGEPILGSGRQRAPQTSVEEEGGTAGDDDDGGSNPGQRLYTDGSPRPIFSEDEKRVLIQSGEVMTPEQLDEYRRRSGNLAPPKKREEYQQPQQPESSKGNGSTSRYNKKRRVD
ncbi:hypothetical protein AA313_de0201685 [Arthrobotrys entomopaga]|nr:hypothetical protein AA313_de0201685 [Arthrobotrys entomopaga]